MTARDTAGKKSAKALGRRDDPANAQEYGTWEPHDERPFARHLREEIARRVEGQSSPPRYSNWDGTKCVNWLKEHPPKDEARERPPVPVLRDAPADSDFSRGVDESDDAYLARLQQAAGQGNAHAQVRLGRCLRDGKGIDQDDIAAALWFARAAEKGDASALTSLGVAYLQGKGVEQDYDEAVQLWKKAAEQDHAGALCNLGLAYSKGEGVKQDYDEAVQLWKKAAEQDRAGALNNLGVAYVYGNGVEQNYDEAVQLWKKAAEQDHASALFNLGVAYSNGHGVDRDLDEAVRLWEMSAEKGDASAKSKLRELQKQPLDLGQLHPSLLQSLRESESVQVVHDPRDDPDYDSDSESEYAKNTRYGN